MFGATRGEIEQHLEMGRKLLAAGQLAEALSHYHSAVGELTHTQTPSIFPLFAALFLTQPSEECVVVFFVISGA